MALALEYIYAAPLWKIDCWCPRNNVHAITWCCHDDVIKWKHFPRYWAFVRGNHRSPMNSPNKGHCRGALMFSLICAWINGWVNNREVGDLRRHRAHCDITVMVKSLECYQAHGIHNKVCPSAFIWQEVCRPKQFRWIQLWQRKNMNLGARAEWVY